MRPQERFLTALRGEEPDEVPVSLAIGGTNAARWVGGDCSLQEAKEQWGDKVCIMGGYDPHVFTPGTREEMRKETIRCIDEAAAGRGYILANTDAIPERAEIEDVKAMVDLTKEYGRYQRNKPDTDNHG